MVDPRLKKEVRERKKRKMNFIGPENIICNKDYSKYKSDYKIFQNNTFCCLHII